MANPGIGSRTVVSLAMEISLHLLQDVCYTTFTSPVTAGAGQTATVGTTAQLFAGAQVVADPGQAAQEIVTVTSVTNTTQFVATFANSHSSSAILEGATFPLQALTDPLYTTAEILSYIARAQNQFLQDVPLSFQRFLSQSISGLINTAPATTIELERIAYLTGGKYSRLYASTQEAFSQVDPAWRTAVVTSLRAWAEDRSGLYGFAVNGTPSAPFTAEYLCSVRDSDTLLLTDHFLIPDVMLHYCKYKVLDFCWSKDGENRSPLMADYSAMRYRRGVMTCMRWMGMIGAIPAITQPSAETGEEG